MKGRGKVSPDVSKFVNSLFTKEELYMPKDEFRSQAMDAGFSMKQIDFLEEYVAKTGHTHEVEDITDFETAVEEIAGDEDGDEEEEED